MKSQSHKSFVKTISSLHHTHVTDFPFASAHFFGYFYKPDSRCAKCQNPMVEVKAGRRGDEFSGLWWVLSQEVAPRVPPAPWYGMKTCHHNLDSRFFFSLSRAVAGVCRHPRIFSHWVSHFMVKPHGKTWTFLKSVLRTRWWSIIVVTESLLELFSR